MTRPRVQFSLAAPPFIPLCYNHLTVGRHLNIVAQCPRVARRWSNGSVARDALEAADMLSSLGISLWPKYWSPDADGCFWGRDHFQDSLPRFSAYANPNMILWLSQSSGILFFRISLRPVSSLGWVPLTIAGMISGAR